MKRPQLTFFARETEDGLSAIVLDLDAKRDAKKPSCVEVRVPFLVRDKDGLRSERELAALDKVEAQLCDRLKSFRYVGFFDVADAATYVFYAPKKTSTGDVERAIGDLGRYSATVRVGADPGWDFYAVLSPDEYETQSLWNDATLGELERLGDQSDVAREIDHWASFPTAAEALKAAKALARAGFRVEPGKGKEICFHHDDAPRNADAFSETILDIVLPLNGQYEWGTTGVLEPKRKKRP